MTVSKPGKMISWNCRKASVVIIQIGANILKCLKMENKIHSKYLIDIHSFVQSFSNSFNGSDAFKI